MYASSWMQDMQGKAVGCESMEDAVGCESMMRRWPTTGRDWTHAVGCEEHDKIENSEKSKLPVGG
jgi:hypothetical protein